MSSSGGWIKLHRMLLDKPIWKCSTPEQKTILITILMMVNHEESEWLFKGEKYVVKPGQMITSLKSIADAAGEGISIRNVRTALALFEKHGFLTNQSTNKNRLITVENWGLYQSREPELTKQVTSSRQAKIDVFAKKRDLLTKQVTNKKSSEPIENTGSQRSDNDELTKMLTSNRQTNGKMLTTNKKDIYKNDKNIESGLYSNVSIYSEDGNNFHTLSFGKLDNVFLTQAEYDEIKDTFQDHNRLINSVSYYLANAERTYKNHYALIRRIADKDSWPIRRQNDPIEEPEQDLTAEDIQRAEEERKKFDEFIKDMRMAKEGT